MHRIKTTKKNKIWHLVLVLVMVLPSTMTIGVTEVQAGGGWFPLVGLVGGLIKRNKVYTVANSFIKEKAQYYDALRDTARQQLLDRELTYGQGHGLRDNQVAAYSKVVALIEQERDSMYDFAESEKKAARNEFMDAIQDEITNRMLATTPATAILGAMQNGLNSSQGFLDAALNKLTGGGGGFLEDVAKVKRIAERMTIAGQLIGGDFGNKIRSLGTNVVDLINKPTAEIEAGLIQVQGDLGALGDLVSEAQAKGYTPTASQTTREVVIHLVSGEEGDPAIAAIADMLVAKHGGGGDFRDRAKAILLGNASARCAARIEQIRQIRFRLEMADPGGEADDTSDMPTCETIDIAALVQEAADLAQSPETESSETGPAPPSDSSESADPDAAAAPDSSESSEPAPPSDSSETSETGPGSTSSEYVWVLTNTEVNPNNEKSAFFGGGQDPTWFAEPRFEGKSTVFGYSANNFTVYDVEVDHEYVYHDVTVGVDFESPPARLESGITVDLKATANHSGTVNEGGTGKGLMFQYRQNDVNLDLILRYSPWDPNFDGTSSETWSLTAPTASEGAEFTISAVLWNAAPCSVIWTYQAQEANPDSGEHDWDTGAALPQPNTPEDCRNMQADVASKVEIARGADTADLELGIIGYVVAQMGPTRIGYC
ncbi:MAG: hypothetical protein MUO54_03775, partial [Anaerolineales bacterium]|nr:hypothetical protein [Anaerolineales bacterium]